MKFTDEANKLRNCYVKPLDWYKNMTQEFIDFYAEVRNYITAELLEEGYVISNINTIITVFFSNANDEPTDEVAIYYYFAEEVRLFFDILLTNRYETATAIAHEITKTLLCWIDEDPATY